MGGRARAYLPDEDDPKVEVREVVADGTGDIPLCEGLSGDEVYIRPDVVLGRRWLAVGSDGRRAFNCGGYGGFGGR